MSGIDFVVRTGLNVLRAYVIYAEIRSMESPLGVRPSSSSESAMQIQTTTTTQQTSYTHSHSIPRGLGMNTEICPNAPTTTHC